MVLGKEQFDLVKNENRILLDESIPILNDSAHMMIEVPALLVLSDPFGNVLKIVGDRNVRKRLKMQVLLRDQYDGKTSREIMVSERQFLERKQFL